MLNGTAIWSLLDVPYPPTLSHPQASPILCIPVATMLALEKAPHETPAFAVCGPEDRIAVFRPDCGRLWATGSREMTVRRVL